MKKFTLLLITILAVGFLGSAKVRGQYVLDDAGYKLIETDGQGQVTTRIVENKDVPWYIRFSPSSTAAGIRDNRTSPLRRFKKAAVAATFGVAALLASYNWYKMEKKYAEPKRGFDNIIDSLTTPEWFVFLSAISAHSTLLAISQQGASQAYILAGAFGHALSSLLGNRELAEVFSKSMVKRTEHLDRNLQLNVVEAAF